MNIKDLPFKSAIDKLGGKIYSVGGSVRDEFLGKESKDLDILITGVPMDTLKSLLPRYGKTVENEVGGKLAILKIVPNGETEEIDVAIPRTETATGEGGYKGFDVKPNHELPIEADLERRDFTINAIAKDEDGNLIDPYGGQQDIKDGIIRAVNPQAFSDDPLRMIRAVQFAARFGMDIEENTKNMIKQNAGRIKEIAGERILEELKKVVDKGGDPLYAADLLRETGLYPEIFGFNPDQSVAGHWDSEGWNNIKTLGEFVFMLLYPTGNAAEIFKTRLKGDIPTMKKITALDRAWSFPADSPAKARSLAHNMYMHSPESINSNIIPPNVKKAAGELNSGLYPKSLKELAINGNDLMQLGLKGKEVGDTLKSLLIRVYGDKVKNNKEDLLNSLNNRG
jgi:tRNA nucleotidyltransferase/poly(A) polymerase